jgi:hypothetical protein
VRGSKEFLPCLAQLLDGWKKEDPPSKKTLPVEVDVPELLVEWGLQSGALLLAGVVGDLTLIAFYFLLRVGEYTIKSQRNDSKQTVPFKLENISFFKRDKLRQLRQLSRYASDDDILSADSAAMTLDNQKNGHKNVCIHHEANGDSIFCPVRAVGRRYVYLRSQTNNNWSTPIHAYWDEDGQQKEAVTALEYPETRGIPIDRVDTHSLRGGGANALSLNGYSDTQIQKLGRWRGQSFKEYIRDELHSFATGMSKSMRKLFGYVVVSGGAMTELSAEVDALNI